MAIDPITQAYALGSQGQEQWDNQSQDTKRGIGIGASILSPAIGGPLAALSGAFGSDNRMSGAERNRNEMEDVKRQLLQGGGLTPEEQQILTVSMDGNTPDQLVSRYRTVADSQNDTFRQLLNQMRGAGNQQDATQQYAYDTFRSTFGRDPSSTEFAQLLPIFGGAEGRQRGAAAIGQMFEAYKQSPEYFKSQAGQYYDDLDPTFDSLLGRDATASENDYFGQQMAAGRSSYEIEQMLRQMPEFQQAEDKKFRTGLASELEGYDTSFFNKAKENVVSRLSGNWGGAGTSSALDFALTDLMGQIAEKRGQYLAGISSNQYGGNKEAARQDYTYGRDQYFQGQDYERRRRDSEEDYYRSRGDQDRDYERQKNDYFDMIGRQNQGRGVMRGSDWLNIGMQGANAYAQSQSGGTNNYYGYLNDRAY